MPSIKDEFERQGCGVVKSIIPPATALMLHHYALKYAAGENVQSDRLVPGAAAGYGHPCMERLLQQLVPTMEALVERSLFPTYSYFRVYRRGDVLVRHKDRPACEISLSLCLGYKNSTPWPLMIEGPAGVVEAALEPGDGVAYKGIELDHWRDPLEGEITSQVFLHYVDQKGPHADWRYDKRPSLRLSVE